MSTRQRFLGFTPEDLRPELAATSQLAGWLESELTRAHETWPELQLDEDTFLRYLAEHFPPQSRLERLFATWQLDDLYLCCACATGHDGAAETFEREFGPIVARAVHRQRVGPTLAEEIGQLLREQLFVNGDRGAPLIARYTGPGRLRSWLWVVATRTARRVLDQEQRLRPAPDAQLERALLDDPAGGAEHGLLSRRHRDTFARALKRALSSLPPRELSLLRYRYLEQLGVQEIGAIYRVHFSTASRWIDRARRAALERTHAELADTLKLDTNDCWSLIRSLAGEIDVTFSSLLGQTQRDPKSQS